LLNQKTLQNSLKTLQKSLRTALTKEKLIEKFYNKNTSVYSVFLILVLKHFRSEVYDGNLESVEKPVV